MTKLFENSWRDGYKYYERYFDLILNKSIKKRIDIPWEWYEPSSKGLYSSILDASIRLEKKQGRSKEARDNYGSLDPIYRNIRDNYWGSESNKYNPNPRTWFLDIETRVGGTIPFKRGSAFFDEEGSPTQKSVLIENGVLKGYMYDRLSAMKAGGGAVSTGNGRRQSYRFKPIPRMTNTMIAPGKTDPQEIVNSLEKGLFVKKMGGGQVNTVNGDFVFEVTEGYLIEKGKIGEAVKGATLTGNGPEVLKKIDMVGSDLGFGIGTCGKDAQGVPVGDAQPTLRIPEITVGGGV